MLGATIGRHAMPKVTGSGPQACVGAAADPMRYWFTRLLLLFLAICFLLQVRSPLRLNNDAITLLSMGEAAARGAGFVDGGQRTVFPPGYPAVLALLLKLGFAHPWVIISLNLIFLAVGLFAAYSVLVREFFEDKSVVLSICLLFLLSYVVIKHFTIPLTDVPFFCCSMCCLAVMSQATSKDSGLRFSMIWGTAWLLALAATTVRRVGLALIPSLVFSVLSSTQFRLPLKRMSLRTKLTILVGSVLVCFGTAQVVRMTSTLSDFTGVASKMKTSALIFRILGYRLTELGELLGNIPSSRLPTKVHFVMPWVGVVLLLLTLLGLATKGRRIGSTEVFLIGYLVILFAWPYYDARFWLPVIPLLVAYSVLAIDRLSLPKVLVTTYCAVFTVLGFISIAYSTQISFAGSKFPDRYGDGNLRPTYCAAFRSCRDGGDPNEADPKVLRLLQEYR